MIKTCCEEASSKLANDFKNYLNRSIYMLEGQKNTYEKIIGGMLWFWIWGVYCLLFSLIFKISLIWWIHFILPITCKGCLWCNIVGFENRWLRSEVEEERKSLRIMTFKFTLAMCKNDLAQRLSMQTWLYYTTVEPLYKDTPETRTSPLV